MIIELNITMMLSNIFVPDENIGTFIQRDLYYSLQSFFENFAESCDYSPRVGRIPLRVSSNL